VALVVTESYWMAMQQWRRRDRQLTENFWRPEPSSANPTCWARPRILIRTRSHTPNSSLSHATTSVYYAHLHTCCVTPAYALAIIHVGRVTNSIVWTMCTGGRGVTKNDRRLILHKECMCTSQKYLLWAGTFGMGAFSHAPLPSISCSQKLFHGNWINISAVYIRAQ
jgi:hypothetical protein